MAYKRSRAADKAKVEGVIAKKNRELLEKYDLQATLQMLQEKDLHTMRAVFSMYQFLWYCTGGLFLLYNWYTIVKNAIVTKKQKKKQVVQQSMCNLEKDLAAQRIDPNAVSCSICQKTIGTLCKAEDGTYYHKECLEKVKEIKGKK